jgi:hypothetical protein
VTSLFRDLGFATTTSRHLVVARGLLGISTCVTLFSVRATNLALPPSRHPATLTSQHQHLTTPATLARQLLSPPPSFVYPCLPQYTILAICEFHKAFDAQSLRSQLSALTLATSRYRGDALAGTGDAKTGRIAAHEARVCLCQRDITGEWLPRAGLSHSKCFFTDIDGSVTPTQ